MIAGRTLALILATVTLSALGQLLLKSGARRLAGLDRSGFLLAALQDARVLSGLVAWAASALCWLLVLGGACLLSGE